MTAGSPSVPPPLTEQLAEGGRLLIPFGDREEQTLTLFTSAARSWNAVTLERRDSSRS